MENIQIIVSCTNEDKVLEIAFSELDDRTEPIVETYRVAEIKIDDLLIRGNDEAAFILGKTVLTLLQLLVENGIGFEEKKIDELFDSIDKYMYVRAGQNDPEAHTHIATKYLKASVDKCDELLLEMAEYWFKKAADTGHEDSLSFFDETWPNVKEAYREKIQQQQEK